MKYTKFLFIGLLVAIPILAATVTTHAQSFRTGNNITVASNRTIDSTLYATGRNIDIAGTVQGDVICAGQNITISGTVTGDVICAGQSIHINGTIEGSVRLAAQNVTVSGRIDRNASVVAQSIATDSDSNIGGDMGVTGQDAIINGRIGRDLATSTSDLTINNTIGRNVHANVSKLRLENNTRIRGAVDVTSPNDVQRQSGAEVNGKLTRHQPTDDKSKNTNWAGIGWLFTLYVVVSMLLVALVLILIMPNIFQAAANTALASMGKTILIGIAATVVTPILIVGLMFTIVGIPLGILLLLGWFIVLFLSGPFAAYLLGRLLLRRSARNAILVMLLGSIVLLILYLIPFLNIIAFLLALWFGVGMILQTLPLHRPRYILHTSEGTPKNLNEAVKLRTKKTAG